MRVLLFGFEKFDILPTNPSEDVVKRLSKSLENIHDVRFEILPTIFSGDDNSATRIEKAIMDFQPEMILGFGVSGRSRITIEAIALNKIDSPKKDNAGKIYRHIPIRPSSPLALETSFDVQGLTHFLISKNIPATVSYFADTYVCNFVYFHCLDFIREKGLDMPCVFIHIPPSPREVNALDANYPSFPAEMIANAMGEYLNNQK
ncbi:MAG: hypothetical protein Q8P05_00585 [Candidatus Diapherotrites archaeon]|nr:hypothetical protein [Candidatus Diapherotrites archaeon]